MQVHFSQIQLHLTLHFDLGAFGLVHKGELIDLDEAVSPVAIKTIRCK